MAMTSLQGASPVSSAQRPHACGVFYDMAEQLAWLSAGGEQELEGPRHGVLQTKGPLLPPP